MTDHVHSPFGTDRFGQAAERFARFFGTPKFIIGQTLIVLVWIGLNVVAINDRWDPYPFILLNLAFSTQAAYAAPLILLAQTRQADRDKAAAEEIARIAATQRKHVESESGSLRVLLQANTQLTETIARLTTEVHAATCSTQPQPRLDDETANRPGSNGSAQRTILPGIHGRNQPLTGPANGS